MSVSWHDFPVPLSPRVRDAMASIGSDRDLRLRTTLRDDVHVWTTWLPVQAYYESIVLAPRDVSEALQATQVSAALHDRSLRPAGRVKAALKAWAGAS